MISPPNTLELQDALLPAAHLSGHYASWVEPPFFPQLPHRLCIGNHSVDSACTEAGAWLALAYVDGPVRLGYTIQITRHCPRFRGILFTFVRMDKGICRLLGKGRNKGCPSGRDEFGILQSRTQEQW